MILHQPPRTIDAAVRRPEVVEPVRGPCEVCGAPSVDTLAHWSGAVLDLCRSCLSRARREDER